MIVDKVEGGLAKVTMSQPEAQVLLDALTIAKLQVGEALLLGEAGKGFGINIEHLRGMLTGIVERK